MKRLTSIAAGMLLLISGHAVANPEDAEGCKDHPLFTRMPNYHITWCDHSQFDMRRIPVGPLIKEYTAKTQEVEGECWTITYMINEGAKKATGLQVQRNFQNAAKQAGGSVEGTYPKEGGPELDETMGSSESRYGTTLKIIKGGKEYWAFVTSNNFEDVYTLFVVARQAMKQDVSVNELADKLNKDGFLTLYVNFDTGKATIKPDSSKTLDDAAGALKAAPNLKVEVGGHTDNAGTPQSNEKLSADRAQAVMAALVQRGVAANRLTAKGYGQNSPIADNRTEDGRAKNRRVELVKK